ncbi:MULTISPECIES: shikimate dehydrogenase [unclassified Isoptericola]|uniref:shikimate dehydrogenase n=1 Tax=unclassified Isoptericola TaxID=2623355 RepID=UPI0027131CD8|nr:MULTISPECIES: shikimate dehydrogenase [unclassified Isoptericola]MDO8145044.1 shikimate dehydrogenase [Isoptericola sp. 178]MDO8148678.1 shikimate dehydrogenase [Isoptericola sp. b515]
MAAVRRAAVVGHPVAHSLSPTLHTAAYEALGLEGWQYSAIDTTVEQLSGVVRGLDLAWAGLSVTMPLKHAVMKLVDHVDPLAQVVGAVNTVLVAPARAGVSLTGTNTDVHGLVQAVREGLTERHGTRDVTVRDAVVLGGGATAASTLAALGELGCTAPLVLVRDLGRTGPLQEAAARMGVTPRYEVLDTATAPDVLADADVVVSTMPARAADPVAASLRTRGTRVHGVLLDVVYDPRPTAVSQAWAATGGTVVGGERMLLHQAVEQVRLMTGRPGPVDAMDAALQRALGAPTG